MEAAPKLDECQMIRGKNTVTWLAMLPYTVNGTELGDQKCRDALFLRYVIKPPDLPSHCDGCNAKFYV